MIFQVKYEPGIKTEYLMYTKIQIIFVWISLKEWFKQVCFHNLLFVSSYRFIISKYSMTLEHALH